MSIGVTGHRAAHPAYQGNAESIDRVLTKIFDQIDRARSGAPLLLGPRSCAPTRLHTLLVDGTDQAAALLALQRGWELVSPLPFGQSLNLAINAKPEDAADAQRLLEGNSAHDQATQLRAETITNIAQQARLFELADRDQAIATLFIDHLEAPDDPAKAQAFALESAKRAALAGRILIEQSDLIIAVWDGKSAATGGSGHTLTAALNSGAPVIWIDPADPASWRILHTPESLAVPGVSKTQDIRDRELETIVQDVICPGEAVATDKSPAHRGIAALVAEKWRVKSIRLTHAFRRIEALFGGESRFSSIVQIYERPDQIGSGSGAGFLKVANNLPGGDSELADKIDRSSLQNFAWADGISAHLSDRYRGGMVWNFLLSGLAIVGGVAYLPLVPPEQKWPFALFEFLLLLAIVIITYRGQKYRWHGRWFETRRVAEYFRHSPLLLMLGVARPPGRWPRGTETSWPEWYVRHALRGIGLPRTRVTASYLRHILSALHTRHVLPQREYHAAKARRLKAVHHNLDRFSEFLFKLAILSVSCYLLLKGGAALDWIDPELVSRFSKTFTLLGVLFPTSGAAIAGIRFFGDFDRFAAISDVTAEKLAAIDGRITLLLQAPDTSLEYGHVAELAHATDDIVISEIENWQAVFGGKKITVPV